MSVATQNFITPTELQRTLFRVLDRVGHHGETRIVMKRAQPQAVLLGYTRYAELLDALDALEDSTEAMRAIREGPRTPLVSWKTMKHRYHRER